MKWLNDILKTAACAGVIMLPVLFSACSDDSNDDGGDGTADSGLVKIAYTADRPLVQTHGQRTHDHAVEPLFLSAGQLYHVCRGL